MTHQLAILNRVKPEQLSALQARHPHTTITAYPDAASALPHLAETDIIALWGFTDPTALLAAAPHVRWLHSLSAGVEQLLPPAVVNSDIIVTNSGGVHDHPVAERVMAMALALAHELPAAIRAQDRHEWQRLAFQPLDGQTMLIVGFGRIGKSVAVRARAFGMHIIAAKHRPTQEPLADEVIAGGDLAAALGRADYVVCALPGTPDTDGYFDEHAFAAMKPGATFINIGRGSQVDEPALIRALADGHIGGAGLDVVAREPLAADSPLWDMARVIITGHSAASSHGFFTRVLHQLDRNLTLFEAGEPLEYVIDKQLRY